MKRILALLVAGLSLPACGAEPGLASDEQQADHDVAALGEDGADDEGALADELGTARQALTAACFNRTPLQTFQSSIASPGFSASNYSRSCGAIFDINGYSVAFLGPIVEPVTLPTTAANCTATSLQFATYDKANGQIVKVGQVNGVFSGGSCQLQLRADPTGAGVGGKNFRFAIHAFRNNAVRDVRARSVALPR